MGKSCLLLVLIVLGLLIMGCSELKTIETSTPTSTPEQQVNSGASSEDEYSKDDMIRLLKRLVSSPVTEEEPSYYPAELPGSLPVEVPVPSDAGVIGSVVRGDRENFEVILDVPKESEAVLEFYRDTLNETGWVNKSGEAPSGGGFTHGFDRATFCRNESSGPGLYIYTEQEEDGVTGVRISLDNSSQSYMCQDRGFPGGEREIPSLKPPEDVDVVYTGSGSSSGTRFGGHSTEDSEAVLKTELSPGELEAHYRELLQEAGWELQEKQETEDFAYSTYNFTDEQDNQWRAGLTVQVMEEDTKAVYLTAVTWD